jgi:hypothetical protein
MPSFPVEVPDALAWVERASRDSPNPEPAGMEAIRRAFRAAEAIASVCRSIATHGPVIWGHWRLAGDKLSTVSNHC